MSSGTPPSGRDARDPTRTLMPMMMSRFALTTSTASRGAIRRIPRFHPPSPPREAKDAGERDVQIGEDAHGRLLDHMPAEAGEIARARAAGVDGRGHPGCAAEIFGIDAERSAAPVYMGMQIDQSRA